jgi:DNA-binding beta-propeller fold protein YncE
MSTKMMKLVYIGFLAGLALVGLIVIPIYAATPPFLLQWGSFGMGNGEFNNPAGVAVSGTTVYVADSFNHRIQKFTVDVAATFVISWGTTGITGTANSQFNTPSAVAVDSAGYVYVADTNNHRIQKFDSGGNYSTQWGALGPGNSEFNGPCGIAFGSGWIYVADSQNNRIQVFYPTGAFSTTWGTPGTGNGQFNKPIGIAVDSFGDVYVADSDNNRIQKFDSGGTFLTTWGMTGTLTGQFIRPTGVAVDSSYNVYVVDSGNNRIQVFGSFGDFRTAWGTYGSGDGQFVLVSGIAVDSAGNSYVADTGNNRIQEFGPLPVSTSPKTSPLTFIFETGSYGTGQGQFDYPTDIALDDAGNVYVVDKNNSRIQKFDSSGKYSTQWGSFGSGDGEFNNPTGIAISGTNVYVADHGNNRVQVFDTNGGFSASWPITSPLGIALDSAGNFYITNDSNALVYKCDSSGGLVTQWGEFMAVGDVAVNTAGQVFVTEAYYGYCSIQKFTNTGSFLAKFGSPGTDNGQFETPTGLAIDRGGNIYVADGGTYFGNNRIQQFSSDHNYLSTLTGTLTSNFTYPRGVAVSGDGRTVYVADTGNNRIAKFGITAPPPDYLFAFGEYGSGQGQFNKPGGIAVDNPPSSLSASGVRATADNYVYVADMLNNRIQKFTNQGAFVLEWSSWDSDHFQSPSGVAYSSANNWVYVADTFSHRIVYFNPSGVFQGQWGSFGIGSSNFAWPSGVAVDEPGDVYVADTVNNRIQKFNSGGAFRVSFGPNISGLTGALNHPSGVAVDHSLCVYISDTGNHRIVKLDSEGKLVQMWGSFGSGDTQFNNPVGITVDSNFVIIADTGNNRLMKYTRDGVFIAQLGTFGSASGQFNNVTGVALDGYGNIYATDTNNHTVRVYKEWQHSVYLPLMFRAPTTTALAEPVAAVPGRRATLGETFYSAPLTLSVSALPSGGMFYLSSQPGAVQPVVVDDMVALVKGGSDLFSYDFSQSGVPTPAAVQVPRSVVEQILAGGVTIEYRDLYGASVSASEVWLIWAP